MHRGRFNRATIGEWIASAARSARANGYVVYNFAHGQITTCSNAGVDAFATQASSISSAFSIRYTLRSAALVRVSLVFSDAAAFIAETFGVRSARISTAEIGVLWLFNDHFWLTFDEGVAFVAVFACADRKVVQYMAICKRDKCLIMLNSSCLDKFHTSN